MADAAERDYALKHLEATTQVFLDAIAGLTEAQWNFKPAPDVWSIGECAEHVVNTEVALLVLLRRITGAAAAEGVKAELENRQVLKAYGNREYKAVAPERIRPTGRLATHDQVVAAFEHCRARTLEWLRDTPADLHAHFAEHPALKKQLDAYQWLLINGSHPDRHAAQIREVKAHAGFPRE